VKRKIIQIAGSSETETRFASVMALCDDGTLWRRVIKSPTSESEDYWAKLPDIPQRDFDPLDPWASARQKRKRIKVKRDILKQIIKLRDDFQRSYAAVDGVDVWLRMPLKCWMVLRKKAEETLDPGQASAAQVQLRAFISMAEKYNLINFSSPDGWVAYGTFLGMKVVVNQGGNLEVSRLRNPNA